MEELVLLSNNIMTQLQTTNLFVKCLFIMLVKYKWLQ